MVSEERGVMSDYMSNEDLLREGECPEPGCIDPRDHTHYETQDAAKETLSKLEASNARTMLAFRVRNNLCVACGIAIGIDGLCDGCAEEAWERRWDSYKEPMATTRERAIDERTQYGHEG